MTQTWTTKDGREILVADMSNSHLENVIQLLRKRNRTAPIFLALKEAELCYRYAATAPDGAAMAAEGCAEDILTDKVDDLFLCQRLPVFASLLDEATKRGIVP